MAIWLSRSNRSLVASRVVRDQRPQAGEVPRPGQGRPAAAQPTAAEILEPLLRKTQRKVQEERWLQRLCHDIRPEDDPIPRVEFTGMSFQRIERKRDEAKKV